MTFFFLCSLLFQASISKLGKHEQIKTDVLDFPLPLLRNPAYAIDIMYPILVRAILNTPLKGANNK